MSSRDTSGGCDVGGHVSSRDTSGGCDAGGHVSSRDTSGGCDVRTRRLLISQKQNIPTCSLVGVRGRQKEFELRNADIRDVYWLRCTFIGKLLKSPNGSDSQSAPFGLPVRAVRTRSPRRSDFFDEPSRCGGKYSFFNISNNLFQKSSRIKNKMCNFATVFYHCP